jgi:hypothetical protein
MVETLRLPGQAAPVGGFAMLSDHERRALLKLQRQFLAEDPDFARTFDEVGQRDAAFSLRWVDAMPRWVPTARGLGNRGARVLMLAIGVAAAALVFVMLAETIVVVRRRRAAQVVLRCALEVRGPHRHTTRPRSARTIGIAAQAVQHDIQDGSHER